MESPCMSNPPAVRPSILHLPAGDWATVLDCLCARFPAIDRDTWLARMARGRVLDGEGRALGPAHPYREGLRVQYFREVADETPIPFEEGVLHVDEHLVVADKPHFLPVMPAGEYVEQTLQARLMRRLGNPHLVPLHRIDRHTAGLVLFSANPASRGRYQALFRERRIAKRYEAIAPALPDLVFPLTRATRLAPGEPFFRMQEVAGEANTETRIEVLERRGPWWRYALFPVTGKKHQLRVHLAALGAPICHDGFYPELRDRPEDPDDYARPLQLLARELAFVDPLSGAPRQFVSRLQLRFPEA
nr:RluA family pseudouridine synthase [Pseudomonas thermotolerans]